MVRGKKYPRLRRGRKSKERTNRLRGGEGDVGLHLRKTVGRREFNVVTVVVVVAVVTVVIPLR